MDIRIILSAFMILSLIPVSANALICGVYFTGSDCKDCQMIDDYIQNEINATSNLTLIAYDLSIENNIDIANMFIDQYDLSESYQFRGNEPFILFSGADHLAGVDEIKECLSLKISHLTEDGGNPCPVVTIPERGGDEGSSSSDEKKGGGGGSEEPEIPGDPDILLIEGSRDSVIHFEEPVNDIDSEIEKSQKLIDDKITEQSNKDIEDKIYDYAPFVYIVILIVIIGASISLYMRKSEH